MFFQEVFVVAQFHASIRCFSTNDVGEDLHGFIARNLIGVNPPPTLKTAPSEAVFYYHTNYELKPEYPLA